MIHAIGNPAACLTSATETRFRLCINVAFFCMHWVPVTHARDHMQLVRSETTDILNSGSRIYESLLNIRMNDWAIIMSN